MDNPLDLIPRTAVNQAPYGGTDYPFVSETPAAGALLDVRLWFQDGPPASCKVKWACGLGTGAPEAPQGGDPTPSGINFVFALLGGTVLFDTTTGTPVVETIGDRQVLEWRKPGVFCRAVVRVAGTELASVVHPDTPLHPRTWADGQRSVKTMLVGAAVVAGAKSSAGSIVPYPTDLTLVAGYNTAIRVESPAAEEGFRPRPQLTFDFVPGAGQGRLPGCDDSENPPLRTIKGVRATADGRFFLDSDGCLRIYPDGLIVDTDPLRIYAYNEVGDRPHDNALVLRGVCQPCCKCDDFVNVWLALKKVRDDLAEAVGLADAAKAVYGRNVSRWTETAGCRGGDLTVQVRAAGNCTLEVGIASCNKTGYCLGPVELRVTLGRGAGSGTVIQPGFIRKTGGGTNKITVGGAWPTFAVKFDAGGEGETLGASFRVKLPNCSPGEAISATGTVHYPNPLDGNGSPVSLPSLGTGYGSAYPIRKTWSGNLLAGG